MHPYEIILYALCLAFFVVEVLPRIKLTNRKPFNCMMCMTGWCSIGLAVWQDFHWPYVLLLGLAGVFTGAMFGAIKMRWL